MWRTVVFFTEVAVAVAVVIWFLDRPGEVFIEWQGWELETSFGVMALAILITVIFLSTLYILWKWIKRQPREILRSRRYRLEAKGYRALTDGLAAVAAGDARVAKKLARKVDSLLKEPSLTLLLSAQAAQLDGDEIAARQYFEKMLDRSEYKRRQAPPGVKIGHKAFGRDRRYPITNAFETAYRPKQGL